jgi:hypothetical protein
MPQLCMKRGTVEDDQAGLPKLHCAKTSLVFDVLELQLLEPGKGDA